MICEEEEQARIKDAADKSDYLHIVEGKEKFYKTQN